MTAQDVLRIKQLSIPVAYVIGLFGSVSWLTTTYNTVEQNRQELIKVEEQVKNLDVESKKLREIVIRIDGKIDTTLKILDVHGHQRSEKKGY